MNQAAEIFLTDVGVTEAFPGLFSVRWLRQQRCGSGTGNGPPFVRIGRNIRYRVSDVKDWVEKNKEEVA